MLQKWFWLLFIKLETTIGAENRSRASSSEHGASDAARDEGAELRSWLSARGGWLSDKIEVREDAGGGRGLFAAAAVDAGETLASIPRAASLLRDNAIKGVLCRKEVAAFFRDKSGLEAGEQEHVRGIFSIMVFLLDELSKPSGPSSRWAAYLQDLDRHWTEGVRKRFPLFWTSNNRRELEGTSALEDYLAGERGVSREYELLQRTCPAIAARHTLESYQRIWSLVNSRVLTHAGDVESTSQKGRAPQSALLPAFDLVNHYLPSPTQRLRTEQDLQEHHKLTIGRYGVRPSGAEPTAPRHLQLWAERPLSVGDEVTDVYGIKANEDFLWSYGFTIPWIHNRTCLANTRVRLGVDGLPKSPEGPAAALQAQRRVALLNYDPLTFVVDTCLGAGFGSLVAFARFWYASVPDAQLHSICGLVGPYPWQGESLGSAAPPGGWRLNVSCPHLSKDEDAAALRLVRTALAARREGIAGGSLEDEERILNDATVVSRPAAWRDAVVVRRDEKYVLRRAEEWVEAKLIASKKRRRRQRSKLPTPAAFEL